MNPIRKRGKGRYTYHNTRTKRTRTLSLGESDRPILEEGPNRADDQVTSNSDKKYSIAKEHEHVVETRSCAPRCLC